jgi:acetyltransferase-like isoleucine patch superfamily enzyme
MITKGHAVKISETNVFLGDKITIGSHSIIEANVTIGNRVRLGRNVIIKTHSYIGDGSIIEDNSIIGYGRITKFRKRDFSRQVFIGKDVLVRNNCVIYAGVFVGDRVRIHHNAIIREGTKIGRGTSIGNFVMVEGHCEIGDHTSIFAHALICPFTRIGNFVFIGPGVVTANDYRLSYKRKRIEKQIEFKGPIIKDGARIGAGAVLMPAVTVGEEAVIGAASLVSGNIPSYKVAMGWPARVIKNVIPDEYARKR